jgi:hypothetical protein
MRPDLHWLATAPPEFSLEGWFQSCPTPWERDRGRVGFANVQDDVARAVLSGWPGSRDGDQACGGAGFPGRWARAESTQGRACVCTERRDKIRPAGLARCASGDRDCRAVCAAYARGNCTDQSRDNQQGRSTALGGCQRHDRPGHVASSRYQSQAIEENCRQISFDRKSRGLALPAGRRGEPVAVTGPLAAMQFVDRAVFFRFLKPPDHHDAFEVSRYSLPISSEEPRK